MLTIFAIPKSFKDPHIKTIQTNAIKSWQSLKPACQIILLGDEFGVSEISKELNVEHIGHIIKNEYGTPLLSSAFDLAKKASRNDILVYVNSDIIFTSDLISSIEKVEFEKFLIAGRRIDLDLKEEIDFSNNNWQKLLIEKVNKEGNLHGFSGIDYFVFPKGLDYNLPNFTVGRIGWDNSFIYQIRKRKIPFIDATQAVTAIHQNHSHFQKTQSFYETERNENFKLAGGLANMLTLREADFILEKDKIVKPNFPRMIFSKLALFYPWRFLLSIKRLFNHE